MKPAWPRPGALRRAWAKTPRPSTTTTTRRASTTKPATNISDSTIDDLSSRPLHPLVLDDLVRHGSPPLSTQALYDSANFSLSILPVRLAHRIRALRNLPFIVVTNPHIAQIHNNYMHSLSTILPYASARIATPAAEESFTDTMAKLVHTHANTIPVLARGFLESRKYIAPDAVTAFLDAHLRARIGTRLVAEQQIALHHCSKPPPARDTLFGRRSTGDPAAAAATGSYIGVIDTALRPAAVVAQCEAFVAEICELNYGVRPHVVLTGEPGTRIAHIPVHLEYIVTELLKNAFRAVVEAGTERDPVEVTIAPSPDLSPPSTSPDTNKDGERARPTPGVTIRIRDRGGGISPDNVAKLWDYGFTTFSDERATAAQSTATGGAPADDALNVISSAGAGGSSLAGLGYGLPLGRAYAEHFGGGIAVQSLWGWGTDVYLTLRGVGSLAE